MSSITPTVGRIVYYKSAGSADGTYPSVDRAAIVTEVKDATTVNLAVLNPTGVQFVLYVSQGSNPQQWDWMPYQKEQAAKAAVESPTATDGASCEGGNAVSLPQPTGTPLNPGDPIIYTDSAGQKHIAKADTVWSPTCINLTCEDGFQAPTSVPSRVDGMTGNYFERTSA